MKPITYCRDCREVALKISCPPLALHAWITDSEVSTVQTTPVTIVDSEVIVGYDTEKMAAALR